MGSELKIASASAAENVTFDQTAQIFHITSFSDSKNIIPKGFLSDYENPMFPQPKQLLDVANLSHLDDEL